MVSSDYFLYSFARLLGALYLTLLKRRVCLLFLPSLPVLYPLRFNICTASHAAELGVRAHATRH